MYIIDFLTQKKSLQSEFASDGKIIFHEYLRIQSFYTFIKKIENQQITNE